MNAKLIPLFVLIILSSGCGGLKVEKMRVMDDKFVFPQGTKKVEVIVKKDFKTDIFKVDDFKAVLTAVLAVRLAQSSTAHRYTKPRFIGM